MLANACASNPNLLAPMLILRNFFRPRLLRLNDFGTKSSQLNPE
jgi:hypothetical protein